MSDLIVASDSPAPDWESSAQEIVCPLCEYNLRGLMEPRCPECGYRFDWAELRASQADKHPYLFEQQTSRRAQAFWKTAVGGLRPTRFWRTLKPAQRSYTGRLWLYFNIVMLLALGGEAMVVGFGTSGRYYSLSMPTVGVNAWPPAGLGRLYGYSFSISAGGFNILCTLLTLFWPLASIAAFMIFRISMRQKKLLPIHALRCVLYSSDVLLWIGLILLVWGMINAFCTLRNLPVPVEVFPWLPLLLLAALPVFFYRLCRAFELYLRFDRPILTVLATQFIVLLAAFTLVCNVVMQPWR
jgi:hypothetical protein